MCLHELKSFIAMKNHKKITAAYLTPRYKPFIGGPELSLQRIVDALSRKKKIDYLVITSHTDRYGNLLNNKKDKSTKRIIRINSPKDILLTETSANFIEWYQTVSRQIVDKLTERANNIDLIYLNSSCFLQFPDLVNKIFLLNKPVILKIVQTESFSYLEGTIKFLQDGNISKLLYIHCISRDIYKKAKEIGFKKEQIFFCPNPIDTKYFSLKKYRDRMMLQKRFGFDNQDLIFVFSGRFAPQKNIDKIVKVIEKLGAADKKVKLLMIGEAIFPEMKLLVKKLKKKTSNTVWTGKLSNKKIIPLLKGADFFIMASKDEGLSNSLIEAMACGLCPVVPKHISGMKDLIRDNINGILYDVERMDLLIDRLSKISPKQAETMRKRARKKVIDYCEIKRVEKMHINFYKRILT